MDSCFTCKEYESCAFREAHGNAVGRACYKSVEILTPKPQDSRYLTRIIDRFKRQEQKGISKYGTFLEDNPRGVIEALEYLAEELTDGLNYIEEAKEKIEQKHMSFIEYQALAARTDKPMSIMEGLTNAVMGMVGEAGETQEHIKKVLYQGHTLNYDKLIEEAGDCLWYIAKLARLMGISLEEIAVKNILKLKKRYPEGFDTEKSVNRKAGDAS